ncbi:hypothetical protein H5410_028865 [Solanum commersonii]|uniref:Uncharacterized protein n=1 Tax=Solanum commersonii TaxID=4109 RepID=A0A9J5Z577_SOLCO|nr:hypothetical protein H5410_028865 [Solanum commersonii]
MVWYTRGREEPLYAGGNEEFLGLLGVPSGSQQSAMARSWCGDLWRLKKEERKMVKGDRICGFADKRSGSSNDFLRQLGHFTLTMECDINAIESHDELKGFNRLSLDGLRSG